jgi:hypothetical protein
MLGRLGHRRSFSSQLDSEPPRPQPARLQVRADRGCRPIDDVSDRTIIVEAVKRWSSAYRRAVRSVGEIVMSDRQIAGARTRDDEEKTRRLCVEESHSPRRNRGRREPSKDRKR